MREVIIVIRCDRCGNEVSEADSQVIGWTWRGTPLQVEVDAKCADELPSEKVEALLDMSTRVEPSKPTKPTTTRAPGHQPGARKFTIETYEAQFGTAAGRFACPLCSHDYADVGGLRSHTTNAHRIRLWEILADRVDA